MTRISGLRAVGQQVLRVAAPGGEGPIVIQLRYLPAVQHWMVDLQHGVVEVRGMRLVRTLNLLAQYPLPFGLLVSSEGAEPALINDLSSGRTGLYLLDSSEVQEIAQRISEGG